MWLGLLTEVSILDVDECAVTNRCLGGHCVNTEGSFSCLCEAGFQPSPESGECVGKSSRGSGQGAAPRLPLPGPQLPGTRNGSFQEAEHFPQINHLTDNAFIEPLLTQDLSKDE